MISDYSKQSIYIGQIRSINVVMKGDPCVTTLKKGKPERYGLDSLYC